MMSFDGKYMNVYLMAIVMFTLSLTIWEIKSVDLENESQGKVVAPLD